MVLLSEMISRGGVFVGINAIEKELAIDEILAYFCDEGKFTKSLKTKIKLAVMEREATGSTGIGNGGAIPHCRIGKDDTVELYIGVATGNIEFQSIDGKPVKVIFTVILPKTNTSIHAESLKAIASFMRNERFFRYLKGAKTNAEVIEIITDYEKDLGIKK
jgi:mannitol/fructose-specific phosphotransferase system IIA component (Ntr-type)